ncbi:hypothetical protein N0V93_007550 [Gnomoniopsis smithogilvyi]|uniref:Uncharacterized protein n=1 Tax=Gnomoniopsis smithogilvyi TaxID=1191159 RepID=A0A9W8YRS7_9PEZI|nr:hypothetical protein N0V93_007550 [Gnomoniopsis smithogilvyi]
MTFVSFAHFKLLDPSTTSHITDLVPTSRSTIMSPSRGEASAAVAPSEIDTETKANIRSSSALHDAKRSLHYLFAPDSPNAPRPAHLRTRALLKSLRYIGIFVFWRIVRYAKYALVGSVVAAVGASAFGGVLSGAAFVFAPPTLLTSIGIGTIWAMGKWGFRKMKVKDRVGVMAVEEVEGSKKATQVDGTWRNVQGPRATPW